jgi:pyruvate dehydrogenase (quinone)
LRALLSLLDQKADGRWQRQVRDSITVSHETFSKLAMVDANPTNPQRVVHELNRRLPERVIVAADSDTTTVWYAQQLAFRKGMMGSVSGTLATMGCTLPYAIAAKIAYPDRPVIALAGDGAMQMNGMAELITIAKYWQRWSDPRLIVMVSNNRDLAFVHLGGAHRGWRPQVALESVFARRALRRLRELARARRFCDRSRCATTSTAHLAQAGPQFHEGHPIW